MQLTLWTTPKNDLIKGFEKEENEFNQQLLAKLRIKVTPEETKRFGAEFISSIFAVKQESLDRKMISLKNELQKIEGYPIVTEINWTLEGDSIQVEKKGAMSVEEEMKEATSQNLGGMLAKALAKKDEKGGKKETSETKPAFYSYLEVKAIKLSEVPEKNFEVPPGYKLVK